MEVTPTAAGPACSAVDRPDAPLYLLHIPKTAGTALRAALTPQFHADRICPFRTMADVLARSPCELERYDFFAGHFGRLLFDFLPRRPAVVTMLRDPVALTSIFCVIGNPEGPFATTS